MFLTIIDNLTANYGMILRITMPHITCDHAACHNVTCHMLQCYSVTRYSVACHMLQLCYLLVSQYL